MNLFSLLFTTCLILSAVLILIKYFQKVIFWKLNNVDTVNSIRLLLGARKKHVAVVLREIYQKMCSADQPMAAIETVVFSAVIVRDVEAIKAITITNFDNFPDRGFYVNNRDAISMNMARLEYKRWKPLRQKLSPIFTPAKTKSMFPAVLEVATRFVDLLKADIGSGSNKMELRDVCVRYTIDVIGNVAFGIECQSLKEPNAEIRVQTDNGFKVVLPLIVDQIGSKYPKFLDFFNVKIYPKELNTFFTRIIRETLEYREHHQIRRNDAMDILIDLNKNNKSGGDFSFEFIVGQAFAFFLGGSQSTANIISFALFELAINPELQTKARLSVLEQMSKDNNQLTYDSLQDMLYLKQVILETLRKYPVGTTMPRNCKRSCSLPTENGSIPIKAGTSMIIPVYAIHHDPKYYPQPEQFRPERFDDSEVSQRPTCTYMPFGIGPKACPADRFAKMNLTLALALLLINFRFLPCERTPKLLEFDPKNMFMFNVKDGIHLKVEKI